MDLQLSGRRAVVTGGGRGIGRAIVHRLALEGCTCLIVTRDLDGASAAAAQVSAETGRPVHALAADTAVDDQVAAMAAAADELLGGVDILVNCAARSAGGGGSAMTVGPALLGTEFDIKTLGYLRCAQAFAPQMAQRGWGRIINVAGLAARQTGSLSAAMRNAAVAALTKTLADELGRDGINVTAVHPGVTRTERIAAGIVARAEREQRTEAEVAADMASTYAIGRLVEPAEVANLVAFLASPLSSAVTGDAIACGGGRVGSIHY